MGSAIVVGGGIGGLSAARALALTGWAVTVYDQAPAFRPVGAGIGIAPNAVKALDWLGLAAEVRARGTRQAGMEITAVSGQRLAYLDGVDIETRFGDPFIALHRAELHRILMDSLDSVDLRTQHRATGVTTGADSATVTVDTGEGHVSATADLVVVADGVHSGLRNALFPDYPGPDYAGYTVWRGIVPSAVARQIDVPTILCETWGRGARFGIAVINDGQVYWFASESMPERATPNHSLAELAERFRRWHSPIPQLLAATPEDTLLRHDVYYLDAALSGFVRGRVALLGDAAHAVTPDIGQGACLSIEDAVVLAAALGRDGVDDGLAAYDAARRPRTQPLARTSGKLARALQLHNPVATALRDGAVRMLPTSLFVRFAAGAFTWTPPAQVQQPEP